MYYWDKDVKNEQHCTSGEHIACKGVVEIKYDNWLWIRSLGMKYSLQLKLFVSFLFMEYS